MEILSDDRGEFRNPIRGPRALPPRMNFDERESALERLLRHEPAIRGLARRLVADVARADDVVQQAWLEALACDLEKVASPKAWLATLVRRAASRLARGDARRERRERVVARREGDGEVGIAESLAREAARRQVVEALVSLEEPLRTTLVLRFLDGLPQREIAKRMGVPVETVHTRLRRGIESMRQQLDERNHGDARSWAFALLPLSVAADVPAGVILSVLAKGVCVSSGAKLGVAAVVFAVAWIVVRTLGENGLPRGPEELSVAKADPPSVAAAQSEDTALDTAPVDRTEFAGASSGPTLSVMVRESESQAALELVDVIVLRRTGSGDVEAWSARSDAFGRCVLRIDPDDAEPAIATKFASWMRGESSALLVRAANFIWHVERPFEFATQDGSPNARSLDREIELRRGIQLRGRVTNKVGGAPIPNATVFVARANVVGHVVGNFARNERATGADGAFEIGFEVGGGSRRSSLDRLAVTACSDVGAAHVHFAATEALDLELTVESARLVLDVRDEAGRAVPGVWARVTPIEGFVDLSNWRRQRSYPGDLESGYLHCASTPGATELVFNRLPRMTEAFRFAVEVVAKNYKTVTLDASFGETTRVQHRSVVLERATGITIHGVVVDVRGNPVAGAAIKSRNLPTVTSDEEGRYHLEMADKVDGNWWNPTVTKEGYADNEHDADLAGRGSEIEHDFTLWKSAPIAGLVIDSSGAPVAGASVSLSGFGRSRNRGGRTTDAAGRFVFEDAGEGTWSIHAWKLSSPKDLTTSWKRFDGLVEGGVSDYVAVLERIEGGGSIDIAVVDAANGEPIAAEDAVVVLLRKVVFGPGDLLHGEARVEGSHVRCDRLVPGRYRVSAVKEGRFGTLDLEVPEAGAHVEGVLRLGARGRIRGRIVYEEAPDVPAQIWVHTASDAPMLPSGGAWAALAPPDWTGIVALIETNPDGSFEAEVPATKLRLLVPVRSASKTQFAEVEVDVLADRTTDLEIRTFVPGVLALRGPGLVPGVRLDLEVSGPDEFRIMSAHIGHDESSNGPFHQSRQVPPGEYEWKATTTVQQSGGPRVDWRPPQMGRVVVTRNETTRIELQFGN